MASMSMSVSFISNISTEGAPDVAEGSACSGGAGLQGESALPRFPACSRTLRAMKGPMPGRSTAAHRIAPAFSSAVPTFL